MKKTTLLLGSIVSSALIFAPIGFAAGKSDASHGHGKSGKHKENSESPRATKYTLRLAGCCALEAAEASGRLDYRRSAEKSGRPNEKFDAKIQIPLPSTTLNLTTPEAAIAAQFRLVFAREGVNFATCALAVNPESVHSGDDQEDDSDDSDKVQYRLRLEKRGTSYRTKRGSCDTDLAIEGDQAGIPDVKTGDVVSVEMLSGMAWTPFLQATK